MEFADSFEAKDQKALARAAKRKSASSLVAVLQAIYDLNAESDGEQITRVVAMVARLSDPVDCIKCISERTGAPIEQVAERYRGKLNGSRKAN